MMVYPEEIHFKLPPSELEKIRQKEIEEVKSEIQQMKNEHKK